MRTARLRDRGGARGRADHRRAPDHGVVLAVPGGRSARRAARDRSAVPRAEDAHRTVARARGVGRPRGGSGTPGARRDVAPCPDRGRSAMALRRDRRRRDDPRATHVHHRGPRVAAVCVRVRHPLHASVLHATARIHPPRRRVPLRAGRAPDPDLDRDGARGRAGAGGHARDRHAREALRATPRGVARDHLRPHRGRGDHRGHRARAASRWERSPASTTRCGAGASCCSFCAGSGSSRCW